MPQRAELWTRPGSRLTSVNCEDEGQNTWEAQALTGSHLPPAPGTSGVYVGIHGCHDRLRLFTVGNLWVEVRESAKQLNI